jgi:hypothetical protein
MAKSQRGIFICLSSKSHIRFFLCLGSIHDDSLSSSMMNNHIPTTHDFENMNSDDELHVHQQQKSTIPVVDVDCYDTSASLLDPQMAAYRAIMSRMVPFANNVNGINSPKRLVKQEPFHTQDESSHGDESDSSSPLNDHLSP